MRKSEINSQEKLGIIPGFLLSKKRKLKINLNVKNDIKKSKKIFRNYNLQKNPQNFRKTIDFSIDNSSTLLISQCQNLINNFVVNMNIQYLKLSGTDASDLLKFLILLNVKLIKFVEITRNDAILKFFSKILDQQKVFS
jgi:hypothetical protein